MLKHLEITNYALIKQTAVSFESGFTVITGETGAGKSILLEALGLVLGSRANFNTIRRGERKCSVEATFEYDNPDLDALLNSNGLDVHEDLILRRELTDSGRSRAFVNDSPVGLGVLKSVAGYLVDLHGQQENLSLQTPGYQLRQLDIFAKNGEVLSNFQDAYKSYTSILKQLDQLRDAAAQVRKDQDYFQFQYDELVEVELDPESFGAIEGELNELEHAGDIQRSLGTALQMIQEDAAGQDGILSLLRSVAAELDGVAGFSDQLKEVLERVRSASIELEDVASDCSRIASGIEHDPARAEILRDKMDDVNRLLHKHGVNTVEELVDIREEYRIKLEGIASYDDQLEELEQKLSSSSQEMHGHATALSATRRTAIPSYVEQLTQRVRQLGMDKAVIKLSVTELEAPNSTGAETVEMMFDANGNDHLTPLKDSASGGEVSRLMLALKSILAANDETPTLIFDEIDTGVSGEIAKQIGQLMRSISDHTQIIAVTHLPGVAAKGQVHIRIAKRESEQGMVSGLSRLDQQERVEEIAGMFSGNALDEASLESARNLLSNE